MRTAELEATTRWDGEARQKYGGGKGKYLNLGAIVLQTQVTAIVPQLAQNARANQSHPKLFRLVREYCELCWGPDFFSDKGYHAVFIAKCKDGTSLTVRHKDKSNIGRSVIHGLGDYKGGDFVVYGSIATGK